MGCGLKGSGMDKQPRSSTSELVRSASWPILGLIILVVFYHSIYDFVERLSQRAGSVERIKIGELELNIKVSDLPRPTQDTAMVLPNFNEEMFVELLKQTDEVRYGGGECFPNNPRSQIRLEAASLFGRLVRESRAEAAVRSAGRNCLAPGGRCTDAVRARLCLRASWPRPK